MTDLSGYDVVIVGSGFAGANLAYSLGLAGKRVLVLEAGPGIEHSREGYMQNFFLNTFKSPSSPYPPNDNSTFMNVSPEDINAPRATIQDLVNGWDGSVSDPEKSYLTYTSGSKAFASTYERLAGGTGNHWMGTCLRMTDDDLKIQSRYGHGLDWPWTYAELKPFYGLAEHRIGVSADVAEQEKIGTTFPTGYTYPMRAIPASYSDQVIAGSINGSPLTDEDYGPDANTLVTSTPAGRNSEPYQGRRVCHGNTNCTPICPIQAKYDPQYTLSLAMDTGNVDLMPKKVVDTLNLDENGNITSVHFLEYESTDVPATGGQTGEGTASGQIFVLACNAIENAKLLLNAARISKMNVANSSGLVGKNLMDHPIYLAWGKSRNVTDPTKFYSYRGPQSTSGVESLRTGPFRSGRAAWRIEFGNAGWNWPIGDPYTTAQDYVYGTNVTGSNPGKDIVSSTNYVAQLNAELTEQFRIAFLVEQNASVNNCIALSKDHHDNLGIPRPEISYQISSYTADGFKSAKIAAGNIMARLDVTNSTPDPVKEGPTTFENDGEFYTYRGAGHLCGTHIMGSDKTHSVVDRFQKSWDHSNLYLVGCGSMPSIGTQNPTLSMLAMTFVTAEKILEQL